MFAGWIALPSEFIPYHTGRMVTTAGGCEQVLGVLCCLFPRSRSLGCSPHPAPIQMHIDGWLPWRVPSVTACCLARLTRMSDVLLCCCCHVQRCAAAAMWLQCWLWTARHVVELSSTDCHVMRPSACPSLTSGWPPGHALCTPTCSALPFWSVLPPDVTRGLDARLGF
jgi:hypothetical protein